jgi:hypothetical protein
MRSFIFPVIALILSACGGGMSEPAPQATPEIVMTIKQPSEERLAAIRKMSDARVKDCASAEMLIRAATFMATRLPTRTREKQSVFLASLVLADLSAKSGGAFRKVALERWDKAILDKAVLRMQREASAKQEALMPRNAANSLDNAALRSMMAALDQGEMLDECLAEVSVDDSVTGGKPPAS